MANDGRELGKQLLEEFWLLSLTLEQVLEDGCWQEVPVLLQRREEALQALSALSPQPEWVSLLNRALDADERCQKLLLSYRQELLNELSNESQQRTCAEHYQDKPDTPNHRIEHKG